jgi:hypothetical protein
MWTPPRAFTADAHAEYADEDVDLNEFRDVEQDYYAAARLQAVARGRSDRRSLAKAGEGEAKVKTPLPTIKHTYDASPPRRNETTSVHPPLSRAKASSGVPRPAGSPSSEYSRFPKTHERSPQHFVPDSKAQERFWGRPQVSLAKVAGSRLTKVEADLVSVFKNLEPEMPESLVVPNAHSSKPAGRARGVGMQWLVNEFAKQSGVPHMREALCAALAVQGAMEPALTSSPPRRQETPSPSARRHAVSWLQQAEAEAMPAMTPPLTPPLTPPPPPPPSPPQIRLA